MTDDVDRAQAHEAESLADALRHQARRASLTGKTLADSAEHCQAPRCGEPIPEIRRRAVPGCQFCVTCQRLTEKTDKGSRYR